MFCYRLENWISCCSSKLFCLQFSLCRRISFLSKLLEYFLARGNALCQTIIKKVQNHLHQTPDFCFVHFGLVELDLYWFLTNAWNKLVFILKTDFELTKLRTPIDSKIRLCSKKLVLESIRPCLIPAKYGFDYCFRGVQPIIYKFSFFLKTTKHSQRHHVLWVG